ncbi:helix-turn-helix domain-containing protein [Parabacteroides gordonii]|uniref:HTH araC/xylS-type domain-containing protein n=1 Tax=Parabacteroides gordonii MS-1 = DSM 23371 TaxID=1203610 RepID=A0A0F5IJJ2_9BACT|nr:AraC family transcriptional regulator [Parabacteroides gordonii]KKB45739.1 hypothetical protein HMPREF1536_05379 [Parabacteroides gordonii MS-1 = DSM 23371]MCA5586297.1 AraC family transcriptional regulator [Parabacteroides gordonii]
MKRKPQFTVQQLFVPPFTTMRRYHEDGTYEYVPLPDTRIHTGLDVFDEMISLMSRQVYSARQLAVRLGVKEPDLSDLVRIATGLCLSEFVAAWQLLMADELLRYTDLRMTEIARYCGMGKGVNFTNRIVRAHKCPPLTRRWELRQKNDLGRFKLPS